MLPHTVQRLSTYQAGKLVQLMVDVIEGFGDRTSRRRGGARRYTSTARPPSPSPSPSLSLSLGHSLGLSRRRGDQLLGAVEVGSDEARVLLDSHAGEEEGTPRDKLVPRPGRCAGEGERRGCAGESGGDDEDEGGGDVTKVMMW